MNTELKFLENVRNELIERHHQLIASRPKEDPGTGLESIANDLADLHGKIAVVDAAIRYENDYRPGSYLDEPGARLLVL
jgi:hypothetical protein